MCEAINIGNGFIDIGRDVRDDDHDGSTGPVNMVQALSFFMKENNAIVLVSPSDRRVADVIR